MALQIQNALKSKLKFANARVVSTGAFSNNDGKWQYLSELCSNSEKLSGMSTTRDGTRLRLQLCSSLAAAHYFF